MIKEITIEALWNSLIYHHLHQSQHQHDFTHPHVPQHHHHLLTPYLCPALALTYIPTSSPYILMDMDTHTWRKLNHCEEDVLPSPQLLAYLSRYPHVRQAFYKPRLQMCSNVICFGNGKAATLIFELHVE